MYTGYSVTDKYALHGVGTTCVLQGRHRRFYRCGTGMNDLLMYISAKEGIAGARRRSMAASDLAASFRIH